MKMLKNALLIGGLASVIGCSSPSTEELESKEPECVEAFIVKKKFLFG